MPRSSSESCHSKLVHPQRKHLGEWRRISKKIFYCAKLLTPSEGDGILCLHDNDILVSHWSCCGSTSFTAKGCLNEITVSKINIARDHIFVNDYCRICTRCSMCTMFGKRCCKVAEKDRSTDRGKSCGCGQGDSGCKKCGLCRSCSIEILCIDQVEAATESETFHRAIVARRSETDESKAIIHVGTHVLCQWRRAGGSVYPGVVTCVHTDGTMDIKYDDGDQDDCVSRNRISVVESAISGDTGSPAELVSTNRTVPVEGGTTNIPSPRSFFRSSLHPTPLIRDYDDTETSPIIRQPASMTSVSSATSGSANSGMMTGATSGTSSGLSAWLRGIAEPGTGLRGQLGAFEDQLEQFARDFRAETNRVSGGGNSGAINSVADGSLRQSDLVISDKAVSPMRGHKGSVHCICSQRGVWFESIPAKPSRFIPDPRLHHSLACRWSCCTVSWNIFSCGHGSSSNSTPPMVASAHNTYDSPTAGGHDALNPTVAYQIVSSDEMLGILLKLSPPSTRIYFDADTGRFEHTTLVGRFLLRHRENAE